MVDALVVTKTPEQIARIHRVLEGDSFEITGAILGSTIIVPRKVEKEDKTLPVLRDLATILASLAAITVALIQVSK